MHSLGYRDLTEHDISKIISEIDLNNDKKIQFSEYLEMMKSFKSGKQTTLTKLTKKSGANVFQVTDTTGSFSTFSEEERSAYVKIINTVLASDNYCKKYLPINPDSMDVFPSLTDGVILCKLINCAYPGTIDERAINKKDGMNIFHMTVLYFNLGKS
jgi:plastin-1